MQSAAHILNSTEFWQAQNDASKYIKHRFQDYGYRLALKLGDLPHRSVYMRLAKNENQAVLETALRFALDFDQQANKGRLFMWKLKQIRAELEFNAAKTNLDPEFVMAHMTTIHDRLATLLHARHQQLLNQERSNVLQEFCQRTVAASTGKRKPQALVWGAATGVDTKYISDLGIKTQGVESARACVDIAKQYAPQAKFIRKSDIRLHAVKPQSVHGIWAGTIWNTLPSAAVASALPYFANSLVPGGVLGIVASCGDTPAVWKEFTHQDQPCLYFDRPENAEQLVAAAGAQGLVLQSQAVLGAATAWLWQRVA